MPTCWTSLIPISPLGAIVPGTADSAAGAVEATTAPTDPATTAPTTAAITGT